MDSAHRRGPAVVLAAVLTALLMLASLAGTALSAAAHDEPCPPLDEAGDPAPIDRVGDVELEDSEKAYRETVDITFPLEQGGYFRDDYHDARGAGTRVHRATDLYHREGSEVYAAVGGVVGGWMPGHSPPHPTAGGGYTVQVHGDDGRLYVYSHLGGKDASPEQAYVPDLRPGDRVERGQRIGWLGDSGNATAPHLHFEIRDESLSDPYGSDRLDPAPSLADAAQRRDHAPAVERLASEDPVDTSLLAGQRVFPEAEHVVLVGSASTAEAVIALPLAAHHDAPVLMTDADSLDERVTDELTRLGATDVTVVGGHDTVSGEAEQELGAFMEEHLLEKAEAQVAVAEGKLAVAEDALAEATEKLADARADIAAVEATRSEVEEAADNLADAEEAAQAAEDEASEQEAAEDEAAEQEAAEDEASEQESGEDESGDEPDAKEPTEAEPDEDGEPDADADDEAHDDAAAEVDAAAEDVDAAQEALHTAEERAAAAERAADDAAERLPALERKTAHAEEGVAEAADGLDAARQDRTAVADDPGAASDEAVTRLAGEQSSATAAAVAERLWAAQEDDDAASPGCAVLAVDPDAATGWHDALTAAHLGAAVEAPVLLTGADGLPEATAHALGGARQAVLVGSEDTVPDDAPAEIAEQLDDPGSADDVQDRQVHVLGGTDRRVTTLAVADALTGVDAGDDDADAGPRPAAWAEGRHPSAARTHRLWVAADKSFADALIAASAAAAASETFVLVGGSETLEPEAAEWLEEREGQITAGRVIGEAHAVDEEVLEELATHLR